MLHIEEALVALHGDIPVAEVAVLVGAHFHVDALSAHQLVGQGVRLPVRELRGIGREGIDVEVPTLAVRRDGIKRRQPHSFELYGADAVCGIVFPC